MLMSGGLDSTITAAIAKQDGYALFGLTVAYGQRHLVEVKRARAVARTLGVAEHLVVELNLRAIGGSALTGDLAVPKDRTPQQRREDIPVTYVPARNTIFLSLALAYAESRDAERIYFGANVLDYSGYPDCRPEFLQAFEALARAGTRAGAEGRSITVRAPLLQLSKVEIIRMGVALGIPFHMTHSCYDPVDGETACGRCDSCRIRLEAFSKAGVVDPVPYAVR